MQRALVDRNETDIFLQALLNHPIRTSTSIFLTAALVYTSCKIALGSSDATASAVGLFAGLGVAIHTAVREHDYNHNLRPN